MQGKNELVFKKSSYSNGAGECVEVAVKQDDDGRAVRDSKDVRTGLLHFSDTAWGEFIDSVKRA